MYKKAIAYVDGSYNNNTKTYGSGIVFVDENNNMSTYYFGNNDEDMATMRNVAGEINAAMQAITEAINRKCQAIDIYYDYEGIGSWADGKWQAKNAHTQAYRKYINDARQYIAINFIHVKAHSKNKMNDNADVLAKIGAGLLSPDAISKIKKFRKNNLPTRCSVDENANFVKKDKTTSHVPANDIVNPQCQDMINAFYQSIQHSESDFKQLRTFGIDGYSNKSEKELIQLIGTINWNYISASLAEKRDVISAAKWCCRGLIASDAVQKINADKRFKK